MRKEDKLIVGYDESRKKDHTCLLVARRSKNELMIINEFFDGEAEEIYNKLIKEQEEN